MTVCLIPLKRFGLASISFSNTGFTSSPRLKLACPTIAAPALVFPYIPLELAAERPSTNSTSPTVLNFSSTSMLYIERASTKTVETIL